MLPSTKGVRGHRLRAAPNESAGSWKHLRQRYVNSTLSLRVLSREAGVSYDALKRRARRERWAAERAAEVCAARRRLDLEQLAQAREEAARAARRLLTLPDGAALGELAEVAHGLSLAVGTLWGAARIASRKP